METGEDSAVRTMGGGMGGRGGRGGYPPRAEESHPDGKKVLKQMSEASGGHFFEVSKKEPIDKIYDAIDEELRYQYSLGYTPVKADTPVGYHKLHLTVKQKEPSANQGWLLPGPLSRPMIQNDPARQPKKLNYGMRTAQRP